MKHLVNKLRREWAELFSDAATARAVANVQALIDEYRQANTY